MSAKTSIEWTDRTFNIAWGCVKCDPGCANCYANSWATRCGDDVFGPNKPRRTFDLNHWEEPLGWQKVAASGKPGVLGSDRPHLVFSSSMCDIFEDHPTITAERSKLWPLIRATPDLHWQLLTKRADRIANNLPEDWGPDGYPNVWLGVSISEPKGCWRADALRPIPARVRFISYEPALADIHHDLNLDGIHWVIIGGESGPGARSCNVGHVRSMVRRCTDAAVAPFVKQLGAKPVDLVLDEDGNPLGVQKLLMAHRKGGDPTEWPEDIRIRQFPEVLR